MTYKKLKDFINFIPGINQSRADNQLSSQAIKYYDQSAFELDFYFENNTKMEKILELLPNKSFLHTGDVVISNTKQVAAIVGEGNAGKVLPMNFTKVEFLNEFLDKRYFLFLFNSFKDIRRQKERETQGTASIQKIPIYSLGELLIPDVALSQQKLMGSSYVQMLQIQNKFKKCAAITESLTCSILENAIKEMK